jgi:hypothetical protein
VKSQHSHDLGTAGDPYLATKFSQHFDPAIGLNFGAREVSASLSADLDKRTFRRKAIAR